MKHLVESPAIDVRDLVVVYPGRRGQAARHALRDVSLTIQPGTMVALLGPNGCGKSTLIKSICGMMTPQQGSVRVNGLDRAADIRHQIGVVFQAESLDPHLTVLENLRDQAVLYGLNRSDAHTRIRELLREAALDDRANTFVKTLSRGLARRVDLVRALLHQPRVILLDEPTVGLDPAARDSFLSALGRKRSNAPLTVLMSTHLIDEADHADRVILMHEGRIVADDTPAGLRTSLGSMLLTIHDDRWSPSDDSTQWVRSTGHSARWMRPLSDASDETAQLASQLAREGVSFSIAPPTLADVFLHRTGAALAERASDASGVAP
ncbi:MAG TPA: ABC transporter ATP-binding protein [Phycisphaerales bacterium]|nr:ABC transporter ATP-binding protein [Phycisphaerales bacterium]